MQAQSTRLAIIEAGARLFISQGYGATSMDEIAAAAGVSRATLFTALGSKAAILKAAYDTAVVGDDEPVALPDRPWALVVRNEPDPVRMITGYAAMITHVSGRVAAIYDAMRGAAAADPEIRALWNAIRDERRGGAGTFAGFVRARGALSPHLSLKEAGDIVSLLIDPGLYYRLVYEQEWKPERFERWLGGTMTTQLLGWSPDIHPFDDE
jgi:AcrR family transcriptional regulator